MDVFVAKFSPSGKLIWSTFLGGPNYDRAYAIEVDTRGFVYVTGRAGRGFPTLNAIQPIFQGYNTGSLYGEQNAFIAKFSPDGATLIFSSYFGTSEMNRDMALDANGDIYVAGGHNLAKSGPFPAAWFASAYKKTPVGQDCYVAKMKSDGSLVFWATYFGGSGTEADTTSIRVDSKNRPILLSFTNSTDLPTTQGAYQTRFGGVWDMFIAKFTADSSKVIFSTYLGGADTEFTETHGLALDVDDNIITGFTTKSPNLATSVTAFRRTYGGSGGGGNYPGDAFVAKFSSHGQFLAATYLGGSSGEGLEGISGDKEGNVIVSGATHSTNFPVTSDGWQKIKSRGPDIFVSKFSSNLSQLLYSTLIGRNGVDLGRTSAVGPTGEMIVAGMTTSTNFPILAAFDSSHNGGIDAILGKIAVVISSGRNPKAQLNARVK